MYPEYPIHIDNFVENQIPDVWKTWVEDTPKVMDGIWDHILRTKEFDKERLDERVIKNEVDGQALYELIR